MPVMETDRSPTDYYDLSLILFKNILSRTYNNELLKTIYYCFYSVRRKTDLQIFKMVGCFKDDKKIKFYCFSL